MSNILVAMGSGKDVRKMVRNQEDAYMEVWKLWAWKCMCSSGSCSWEVKTIGSLLSPHRSALPPPLANCDSWHCIWRFYLDHEFKLVHAQSQFSHAGFKELSESVVLHQLNEDAEGLLFWHLSKAALNQTSGKSFFAAHMKLMRWDTDDVFVWWRYNYYTCMSSNPTMNALPWQ